MGDQPFITLAAGGMRPESSPSPLSSESSSDNNSPRDSSPTSSVSTSTHDTSRTKYHIDELGTFAARLENAASSIFPNKGRSRYNSVRVLLLRWEEDSMGVQYELEDLAKLCEGTYGYQTETWLIPAVKSHFALMEKALQVVRDYGKADSLLIVYYAGHGLMNASRQAVWSCSSDIKHASLQWHAIQTLFEQADSDVLLLLDCCAAASGAPTDAESSSVTETIAACGFETWAPQPGRHSFTNTLLAVLDDWQNRPAFTAAMLHCEILNRLRHEKPEKYRNTKNFEYRKSPIHVLSTNDPKARSVELSAARSRPAQIQATGPSPNTQPPGVRGAMASKIGSYGSDDDEDDIQDDGESRAIVEQQASLAEVQDPYTAGSLTKVLENGDNVLPQVLITLALEEEQLLDFEQCRRWLQDFPALAKYATVQGIYRSNSTLLVLSLPVPIWDWIPDDPACSFIGYVHSRNLLHEHDREVTSSKAFPKLRRQVRAQASDMPLYAASSSSQPEPPSLFLAGVLKIKLPRLRRTFHLGLILMSILSLILTLYYISAKSSRSPMVTLDLRHPGDMPEIQVVESFYSWSELESRASRPHATKSLTLLDVTRVDVTHVDIIHAVQVYQAYLESARTSTIQEESPPKTDANIATADPETLGPKYDGLSRGDGSTDCPKGCKVKADSRDNKSTSLSEFELPGLGFAVPLLFYAGLGLALSVILGWSIHCGQSRSTEISDYASDIRRTVHRVTRAIGQFLRTRIPRAIFLFRVSYVPLILMASLKSNMISEYAFDSPDIWHVKPSHYDTCVARISKQTDWALHEDYISTPVYATYPAFIFIIVTLVFQLTSFVNIWRRFVSNSSVNAMFNADSSMTGPMVRRTFWMRIFNYFIALPGCLTPAIISIYMVHYFETDSLLGSILNTGYGLPKVVSVLLINLGLVDLSAEIPKLYESTKRFGGAMWRFTSSSGKTIGRMAQNILFLRAFVLPMLVLIAFDNAPVSILSVAVLILLLLSVSTNVLGLIFLQFDAHLLMRDVSVEEMVPFNLLFSHRYLSEYGFKPWVRQWRMVWGRLFGFCAKALQWITIPIISISLIGPIGTHHDEDTLRLTTFKPMNLVAVVVLNLLLVEISRVYERTKDFQSSINVVLRLPLTWILMVNASIGVWWRHATRNLTYPAILRLKAAAALIICMLWTSFPWIYWAFGTSLSQTQWACLKFIISSIFVTWFVLLVKASIQSDHLAYPKSKPSIVANLDEELVKIDVVSHHASEDDTVDVDAGILSNQASADPTGLDRTSMTHSEDNSESSLDHMIFGPTTTHGQETPTSSYGSFSEQDPLYREVVGQSNIARIRTQPLTFQRSKRAKRAKRDTRLPPEIIITGPGLSSPQSAQKASLRSGNATSTSCTECRRRKLKCDQAKDGPCNNCAKRFPPVVCAYEIGNESPPPSQDRSFRLYDDRVGVQPLVTRPDDVYIEPQSSHFSKEEPQENQELEAQE